MRDEPAELTIVAFVIVIIVVIAIKAWTGSGTPLRGGLPSGHAALAFAGWIAVTYAAGPGHRFLISTIAFARGAARRPDPGRVGRPLLARGRCSAGCSARCSTLAIFQFSPDRSYT